jgi:hypothetical protein
MRNEAIYLFVFIGLNKTGATSAGMRSQPFGSLVKALLDIACEQQQQVVGTTCRRGFSPEPSSSYSRLVALAALCAAT